MGREANVDNMHATYIVLDTTAAPENDIVKVQRPIPLPIHEICDMYSFNDHWILR